MNISYNWLSEYLPVKLDPDLLSDILTAIGLEVESLEKYEEVKGSMKGLVIGEVLEVNQHPGADRLKVTRVDIGTDEPLKIVCGAPNVAAGQKVVVATVGTTIYPFNKDPMTMKAARIRGEDSYGMICAEDEIGLGEDHGGILVLENGAKAGQPAGEYFRLSQDWIYEIGLTPNRMDAMSHLGVARDVCAWLSNREEKVIRPLIKTTDNFKVDNHDFPIAVQVENTKACPRYAGVSLTEIKVAESPAWLKQKLKAIGVRPINNVVDITNFVLHECGQPLHAFDGDAVTGRQIIVKNLPHGTPFVTLDGKERKLDAEDLMICNAETGMCIAGVFGGLHSGVTHKTTRIFLESACFNAVAIRRTSFRHDLRTDAAIRFEKGVDISGVIYALKRAAGLMVELCGAKVASDITDIYPQPQPQTIVKFSHDYLSRLSGKDYAPSKVKAILSSLGFEAVEQNEKVMRFSVPYSKPDIALPADLAEEVMRIDGYDNVAIPSHISLAPALTDKPDKETLREKIAGYLTGNGFYEIFTNSITNSRYYNEDQPLIHLINNLSSELDIMRPSLLETGLEAIAYNLNRQQLNILFFEFGKTYLLQDNDYVEKEYLALFLSGNKSAGNWLEQPMPVDNYFLKGHIQNIFSLTGLSLPDIIPANSPEWPYTQNILTQGQKAGSCTTVHTSKLQQFGIRQPVWYAELDWRLLCKLSGRAAIRYNDIPKYPSVRRDLALILDKNIPFAAVESTARAVKSNILQSITLFDVFESEKLGKGKKSYAVSFIFCHPEKTLTDKEIDKVMQKLIHAFENELQAEFRK
jgi:phenylalanyl-tRNA synthetase beta chain